MRKHFAFTILNVLAFSLFAQTDTLLIETLKLKRGIYLSFKEIRTNNPGIIDSFIIIQKTKLNHLMWSGGGEFKFELVNNNFKHDFQKLKEEFVGISDGNNFYISDMYTVGGWYGMSPCILNGPYIIAPIQGNTGKYIGIIGAFIKVGSGYMINIIEARSKKITQKLLKELISKYPDISKEYADKTDLLPFCVEIMDKINKKS